MISDINISNCDFKEPEKNVNENYLGTEINTNNAPVTITVTSPCYSPFASELLIKLIFFLLGIYMQFENYHFPPYYKIKFYHKKIFF